MSPLKSRLGLQLITLGMISLTLALGFVQITAGVRNNNAVLSEQATNASNVIEPTAGAYSADILSVDTSIVLTKKGKGTVAMLVNCTAQVDHFGIYIGTLTERSEIITSESYAVIDGEQQGVTFALAPSSFSSYLVYLTNESKIQADSNVLYYIKYSADFFFTEQVKHFEVDPSLISINLRRPIWEDALLYQKLNVTLPVELSETTVSNATLESLQFTVAQTMQGFYNISYLTLTANDKNLLVFSANKTSLPENGAFQAIFYLDYDYFSLPMMLNWLVILLVLLFTLGALFLFLVVITAKNKTESEIRAFKKELYAIEMAPPIET